MCSQRAVNILSSMNADLTLNLSLERKAEGNVADICSCIKKIQINNNLANASVNTAQNKICVYLTLENVLTAHFQSYCDLEINVSSVQN